jgi:Rrf2 family protein
MKLTAQEEYGLRCLIQVARGAGGPDGTPVSIRTIAESEGLSIEYTGKLLRVLRQADLLVSTRGVSGGYTLVADPSEITVWRAMKVLDSPFYNEAFCDSHSGNLASCVHSSACSIRVLWQWVGTALEAALERVTLADLIRGAGPVQQALDTTQAGAQP